MLPAPHLPCPGPFGLLEQGREQEGGRVRSWPEQSLAGPPWCHVSQALKSAHCGHGDLASSDSDSGPSPMGHGLRRLPELLPYDGLFYPISGHILICIPQSLNGTAPPPCLAWAFSQTASLSHCHSLHRWEDPAGKRLLCSFMLSGSPSPRTGLGARVEVSLGSSEPAEKMKRARGAGGGRGP